MRNDERDAIETARKVLDATAKMDWNQFTPSINLIMRRHMSTLVFTICQVCRRIDG